MKKILIPIYILLILILLALLVSVPYIEHYNNGNMLYKKGDYAGAISEYERALESFPPKYKECSIRINLALAMLKGLDSAYDKNAKINILTEAKSVLCEKGCANENDDNGHSEEAEKLKKDIERELEKLQDNTSNQNNNNNKKEEEKKEKEDKQTEEKMKQLEESQKEAMENRQQDLEDTNQLYKYKYYSGKTW